MRRGADAEAACGVGGHHPTGCDDLAISASLRYLRLRYEHDVPCEQADVTELPPEAILGYQWHPFHNAFYLQPWLRSA